MRCEPKLTEAQLTRRMWLKTLTSITLLTSSNLAQHYQLVNLDFPYHILVNLLINNIVCVFCSNNDTHFFWDFIWKLATSLSQLNIHCFQVKVALDTLMVFKLIADIFQTKSTKRLHKPDSEHHAGVTTYLERRPSIHKTNGPHNVETKVNETFLAHKIFSMNLGKPTPRQGSMHQRSAKKQSESDGSFDFSRVKLNRSSLRDELPPNTWSPPTGTSPYAASAKTSPDTSTSSSSLLKPARLSFSPVEEPEGASAPSTSLSQTLFYSNTPRVVYVQIPNAVAEQGYLKLVCYLFTLVIVYIIYNEYRFSKIYRNSGNT